MRPDPVPSGREILDRVTTPAGEWQLQRRGSHYEIICSGVFLMASYNRASDRALAALALERSGATAHALRVLVGGLGIGFTVQAALEDHRVGRVDVVEIEPVVVAWHRAYFAPLCGHPLEEARTHLTVADLVRVPLDRGVYDAILLDTDNGPGWLARDLNAGLYDAKAARRFLDALTPQGVLAYWSAEESARFAAVLRQTGAEVEAIETPEEMAPGRASTAWIYLARRT